MRFAFSKCFDKLNIFGMKSSSAKKVIVIKVLGKALKDLDTKFYKNRLTGAGDISDLAIPEYS